MALRSSLLFNKALHTSVHKPFTKTYFASNLIKRNATNSKLVESSPADESAEVKIGAHTVVDTGDFIISEASPDFTGPRGREPMKLIYQIPPIEVEGRKAICDGGGGPLGHPKVFVNLDKDKPIACGYCGLRFVQKHGHHGHH